MIIYDNILVHRVYDSAINDITDYTQPGITCSKLTVKTPERRQWRFLSKVFYPGIYPKFVIS